MPAQVRRTTLSRRQQASLDRLSQSQRLFFIHKNNILTDEVQVVAQEVDAEGGLDGICENDRGSIDAAESVPRAGGLQIDTALCDDEHVQLENNRHQRISPLHFDDDTGGPMPETKPGTVSFGLRSISETIEEHIDHNVENPPVGKLDSLRKQIGCIVNNGKVQGFILALIVINAIMMGVATFPFVKDDPDVGAKFELIDEIFLIIFTIEATMQLAYHGWALFKDAWLVFDLTVVALSWALEGIKGFRAFRIFRALRLIARIGVMRNLITAVISVLPNLTGILLLLLLVFYIFAVMFTVLCKDVSNEYPRQKQYFVALPETFFTLFQMMTLDGWQNIYTQAYNEYWWSWILFIAFIVVTAFVFANLIIAVICDAVHVLGDDDVAGLIGYAEGEVTKGRLNSGRFRRGFQLSQGFNLSTIDRLREMEAQLDQIVRMKYDLLKAMNVLFKHSESKTSYAGSSSFDEDAFRKLNEKQRQSSADIFKATDGDVGGESESGDRYQKASFSPHNGDVDSTPGQTKACQKDQCMQFPDVNEEFVENISQVIETPTITRLDAFRIRMGRIVNNGKVQGFILALIVINAIMMGVATFPFVKDNPDVVAKYELIDEIFLIVFTIEATMQLAYHGWTLFKDAWLVFDLTIVALSWALVGIKGFRAFRIFRALRLVGRIDVMKNLIIAVISVIPNLTGIGMLLFLVFYIFAVMFTQLLKDVSKQYPRRQQYFVALPETFFTLFQMMTLDGWKIIFAQAYNEYWWSWILFVAFIVVTAFVFFNLIIAVICDSVHVMSDRDLAGLTGFDEDEITKIRSRDPLELSPRASNLALGYKLREIERSIDEIVSIQNQMVMIMAKFAR